jgi:hypothetical protein
VNVVSLPVLRSLPGNGPIRHNISPLLHDALHCNDSQHIFQQADWLRSFFYLKRTVSYSEYSNTGGRKNDSLLAANRATNTRITLQQLQATLTDHIVTASLLRAPAPVPENVHLNLPLRVSAFPALAFENYNTFSRFIF